MTVITVSELKGLFNEKNTQKPFIIVAPNFMHIFFYLMRCEPFHSIPFYYYLGDLQIKKPPSVGK